MVLDSILFSTRFTKSICWTDSMMPLICPPIFTSTPAVISSGPPIHSMASLYPMIRTSGSVMRTSRPSIWDRAVAALPVPILPISRRVSSSMEVSSS